MKKINRNRTKKTIEPKKPTGWVYKKNGVLPTLAIAPNSHNITNFVWNYFFEKIDDTIKKILNYKTYKQVHLR
jgi:hypothetical protein